MSTLASIVFALAGIHVGAQRVLPVGHSPAWSPNAERIAYSSSGNLWVADADGTHRALLERGAANPDWAPSGRRLAFSRNGWIWTVRADGNDERRLARGNDPAWSPHGQKIAYDDGGEIYSINWFGGRRHKLAPGTEPAYAPDGRLAFVRDDEIVVGGKEVARGDQPTWAPDSTRLAYVYGGMIYVSGRAVTRGTQPDWRPAQRVRQLLPDLVQRPPTDLVVAGHPGLWLLGFTSLVDNVGLGPLIIVGVRPPGQKRMDATQHVLLANGKWTTYPDVGLLRYTNSQPHYHWHLMRYDSYELHSLTGKLLIRDRKAGFCLADHYGIAPGNWPDRHPRFLGNCQAYNPEAKRVVEGTSLGYTDRYPAFFAGQNDNITGLVGGVYDLVHRVNSNMSLHELRYENDAASVRIRLSWQDGTPTVNVLRRCPGKAVC
ncbi:MAG TPA: lysyl oxidase family protein [Gaiellaceae bacterium]|nr:lysyl oxidase family protein [Gaiellaceae bacterium]